MLESLRGCLKPGGNVMVLVPQGRALFGSLDRAMGHQQRFSAAEMRAMLEQCRLPGGADCIS